MCGPLNLNSTWKFSNIIIGKTLSGFGFALLLASAFFWVGLVHYLQDTQVSLSANITSNLSPMVLFTYLKIILLQCFQFSVISGIQTDPLTSVLENHSYTAIVKYWDHKFYDWMAQRKLTMLLVITSWHSSTRKSLTCRVMFLIVPRQIWYEFWDFVKDIVSTKVSC